MTEAQKRLRELREKQSKDRQKLIELSRVDELTDEQRSEMDTLEQGQADLERQLRAAQLAVDAEEAEQTVETREEDGEDREIRELRGRIRLAGYVRAAVEQRAADGAELEYNQALGLAGNRFPLELLAPAETRATTDADTTARPSRWLDRLFAGTAAAHLGITMESVESGVASYPVTTAGASAAQRGRSEAAADAAWTVGVSELKPTRNTVRLVFNVEDAARIPGLESALNRDLRMALTEGVDRAVFLGDAGANENTADIAGLDTAADVLEQTITQANKTMPAETLAAFLALVDGIHASMVEDLRVVLAVGAHNLWAGTVANSAAENQTILAFLKANGLTCMTRGSLEDATADGDLAAFVGRGRGIEGAGVAAVWDSGELVRDPYTNAAKGEVALTLTHLWAFGLPRPTNFARIVFDA